MFQTLQGYGHEQLIFCSDAKTGLRAIIGIHDTALGPSLGGTRMWNYENDEQAIKDVLRLSRGMSYKAAVAGLNLGGGKAVIIGDSRTQKTEGLFRSFGRFVESLNGRYITAEDVGTTVRDMMWIAMETKHVTGVDPARGGSGDPSPFTAFGVYHGMKGAAKFTYGSDSLAGKRVAVQGAGNVARYLVEYLVKEGAKVFVTDIYEDKVREVCANTGAEYVAPDAITDLDCDIFSPNALGGTLNEETIPRLKCQIVCGGANNQLADELTHSQSLKDRNIVYAPDYVVNAGGLMNVASELDGYNREGVMVKAQGIYDITLKVLITARERNIFAIEASNQLAEERIASIRHIHGNTVPSRR